MDEMRLRAYAKINLGLDVVRRREDGYHEVRMVMQTVKIYDRLRLVKERGKEITVRSNLKFLPTGPENIAWRAAKLLFDEFGLDRGLTVELDKHIPVAAGMAGGSADAAAVLYGLNRLFGLGLSQGELMVRGQRLGADVPFCIMRGTALAEGIGEVLSPLPPMPDCHILTAKPSFGVSTAYVYENLHVESLGKEAHPDIDGIVTALGGGGLAALSAAMREANILETVTAGKYPVINGIKAAMTRSGALVSLMSGSGPTVFGVFDDRDAAAAAARRIKDDGLAKQLFVTEPYTVPYNTRRETTYDPKP